MVTPLCSICYEPRLRRCTFSSHSHLIPSEAPVRVETSLMFQIHLFRSLVPPFAASVQGVTTDKAWWVRTSQLSVCLPCLRLSVCQSGHLEQSMFLT